ncbi:hypothetical protein Tco_0819558, partial [Tanacetum coccineum]
MAEKKNQNNANDHDIKFEDMMIGVTQSSTSILTPIHVDLNKGKNANMEPETLVGSTQNLSTLTCETTLDHPHGNNVGVSPTIQSRKEYHKSYYQHRKQKNIATDVSEEDNISQDDSYDFVYNGLLQEHFLLKQQPPCVICGAKKIQYKFPNFCCMNGKTTLQPLDIPPKLYNLFTSQCQLGKMFRKNIRAYNTNFSFASMGVNLDKRYSARGSGVYTFRVQG